MEILRLEAASAEPIGQRPYEVKHVASIELAQGEGEVHAYTLYFEAGGEIAPHEAGFGQILFAVAGDGWVSGDDGERIPLAQGEAAIIRRGEIHSKGSETGRTAFMVQVHDLTPLRR